MPSAGLDFMWWIFVYDFWYHEVFDFTRTDFYFGTVQQFSIPCRYHDAVYIHQGIFKRVRYQWMIVNLHGQTWEHKMSTTQNQGEFSFNGPKSNCLKQPAAHPINTNPVGIVNTFPACSISALYFKLQSNWRNLESAWSNLMTLFVCLVQWNSNLADS